MNFKEYLEENAYNELLYKRLFGRNPKKEEVIDWILKTFNIYDSKPNTNLYGVLDRFDIKLTDVFKAYKVKHGKKK
jgi:hypothetical protein